MSAGHRSCLKEKETNNRPGLVMSVDIKFSVFCSRKWVKRDDSYMKYFLSFFQRISGNDYRAFLWCWVKESSGVIIFVTRVSIHWTTCLYILY